MDNTKLEIKGPAAGNDEDEIVLYNVYEQIISDQIRERIPAMGMCSCPKCFSDACAMALNQLMPKYVTTRQGELLSTVFQMKQDITIDISVIVTRSMHMVKESPKH